MRVREGRFASRVAVALLAVAVLSSLVFPAAAQRTKGSAAKPVSAIEVSSRRLDGYQRGFGSTKQFGRLEFRGGLVMTSPDERFGGFSGLIMSPDGRRLLAVSDEGYWLSASIAYAGTAPSGLDNARMGPILALNGRPLTRKRDSDAEELTLISGTLANGVALVAFERNHRLVRHPIINGALGRPTALVQLPTESKRMTSNSGLEAVTVLRGGPMRGAILAFAEDLRDANDNQIGWLLGKGPPKQLAVKEIGGFALTGAASLDDGSVLLLERRFRFTEGVRMRLRHIPAADVRPGAVIEGEILVASDMSYEIDNMEAVAVHTSGAGDTVVTLMSDDNYRKVLQRNLLLQFTLHPAGAKATAR